MIVSALHVPEFDGGDLIFPEDEDDCLECLLGGEGGGEITECLLALSALLVGVCFFVLVEPEIGGERGGEK
jgi:hypothetical protein